MNVVSIISNDDIKIVADVKDIAVGTKKLYVEANNNIYDPDHGFLPHSDSRAKKRLSEKFQDQYSMLLPFVDDEYNKMVSEFNVGTGSNQQTAISSKLEEAFVKTVAEFSVGSILNEITPKLEDHIFNTFGPLPKKLVVQVNDDAHEIEGVVHSKFELVVKLAKKNIPIMLVGPAGTGKNVICQQLAEALGLEFYFSNAVTQEYKLTGFIDANGTYHDTQFYNAFKDGGVFMLDEIDASVPEVLIILNAAISNGYFDFPTGRVVAHEDFRCIAAGNTFGKGANLEYVGRYQLDAASLDRFAIVDIDYDEHIELELAQRDKLLVEFMHEFRKAVESCGIRHIASYRSISRIAECKSIIDSLEDVMRITFLKSLTNDDITTIIGQMKEQNTNMNNPYVRVMTNMV